MPLSANRHRHSTGAGKTGTVPIFPAPVEWRCRLADKGMTARGDCASFGEKQGRPPMRHGSLLAAAIAVALAAGAVQAQEIRRIRPPESPISASVGVPVGHHLVYVSGTVPDVADPN